MTRYDELQDEARGAGFLIRRHSPGDGVTRYRFFRVNELRALDIDEDAQTYFGPASGDYTALGLKEARQFLAAGRSAMAGHGDA